MQPSIEDFVKGYIPTAICKVYKHVRRKFRKYFPRKKLLLVYASSLAPVGEAYPKFNILCQENTVVNREIVGEVRYVSWQYAMRYGIDFFIPVWILFEHRHKYGKHLKIVRGLTVDCVVYLIVGLVFMGLSNIPAIVQAVFSIVLNLL